MKHKKSYKFPSLNTIGNKGKYSNGTGFNFISDSAEHLDKTSMELKELVFETIQAKPYILDWGEIIHQYHKYLEIHGKIDIDEFVFTYVLVCSLLDRIAPDNIIKEAMYLDVRAELMVKKAN